METAANAIVRNSRGQFVTGHKQVSPGRPKGARDRHSRNLLQAFADDFEQHGVALIAQVRQEQPAVYLKLAVDLLPRDVAIDLAIDHRVQIEAVLNDFRGLNLPDPALKQLFKLVGPVVVDAEPAE